MTTTENVIADPKAANSQDGTGVIELDPWLEPYSAGLKKRYSLRILNSFHSFVLWLHIPPPLTSPRFFRFAAYKVWKERIDQAGGYDKFSRGYETMGFTISKDGITYREWAPNAKEAALFGDFSTFLFPFASSLVGLEKLY